MHRGYIKLWRKIEDWEWADDLTTFAFFVRLQMMANWENKKWRGITVPRGSFVSSYANLSEKFRLSVQAIRTLVKRLIKTNELTIQSTNKYTIYTIVNYEKYQTEDEVPTSSVTNDSTNESTGDQQTDNIQLTTTKEVKNIKKKVKNIYSENSDEIRLSELLFSLIKERDPQHKQPNFQTWGKHINLLIKRDNRSPPEIEKAIRWVQRDEFWQNNVLSTAKLRDKFGQIFLKMNKMQKGVSHAAIIRNSSGKDWHKGAF